MNQYLWEALDQTIVEDLEADLDLAIIGLVEDPKVETDFEEDQATTALCEDPEDETTLKSGTLEDLKDSL